MFVFDLFLFEEHTIPAGLQQKENYLNKKWAAKFLFISAQLVILANFPIHIKIIARIYMALVGRGKWYWRESGFKNRLCSHFTNTSLLIHRQPFKEKICFIWKQSSPLRVPLLSISLCKLFWFCSHLHCIYSQNERQRKNQWEFLDATGPFFFFSHSKESNYTQG